MAHYTFEDIADLIGPIKEWPHGYLAMYKKLEDRKAYDHILHLTETLEQRQENLSKWFSYCIVDRRWTYLNGHPKYYNHNAL